MITIFIENIKFSLLEAQFFFPFNRLFLQQRMPGDTELSHSEIDCDLNMTYF